MWQETGKVLESSEDLAGLESIIRQHSRFVFKVAYGVLRNSHDAEDVVQEVFFRVHRSGVQGVKDIKGWLATLAFRLAIDRVRKPQPADMDGIDMPDTHPGAEHLAIHRQQVRQVQQLIATLPDDLRYPLVLSAIDELNSREIAEILGISEAAVRGRIFRARALLKEKLMGMANKHR